MKIIINLKMLIIYRYKISQQRLYKFRRNVNSNAPFIFISILIPIYKYKECFRKFYFKQ